MIDMNSVFDRKLNFEPLFDSLKFGLVVGIFCYLSFGWHPLIGLFAGLVAFGIESSLIYPLNLAKLYGYWHVDNTGIYYYDYQTLTKRIKAILLPQLETQTQIKFAQITNLKVVTSDEVSYLSKTPAWLRKDYYLELTLVDGQTIDLDLSWNTRGQATNQSQIDQAVNFIKAETQKELTSI